MTRNVTRFELNELIAAQDEPKPKNLPKPSRLNHDERVLSKRGTWVFNDESMGEWGANRWVPREPYCHAVHCALGMQHHIAFIGTSEQKARLAEITRTVDWPAILLNPELGTVSTQVAICCYYALTGERVEIKLEEWERP